MAFFSNLGGKTAKNVQINQSNNGDMVNKFKHDILSEWVCGIIYNCREAESLKIDKCNLKTVVGKT